jgi:hypothetical protein
MSLRLRPRRRSVVVWSWSDGPADRYGAQRFARPTRSRRFYRRFRHGVLLAVVGAVRLAGIAWARWLLAGAVLTVVGIVWRGGPGGVVLLPGLLFLGVALFTPSSSTEARMRHSTLERELAAYSTPAQRQDLEAIFDRYPDGATHELRDILASQTMAAYGRQQPSAGRH